MRNPGGYACIVEPDRPARECDTFTCAHCNRVTHVKARARPEDIGGLCKQCLGLIGATGVGQACGPFGKKLEAWVFNDVDRAVTFGLSLKGAHWRRPGDTLGA